MHKQKHFPQIQFLNRLKDAKEAQVYL